MIKQGSQKQSLFEEIIHKILIITLAKKTFISLHYSCFCINSEQIKWTIVSGWSKRSFGASLGSKTQNINSTIEASFIAKTSVLSIITMAVMRTNAAKISFELTL